jgi:hypothetical protein
MNRPYLAAPPPDNTVKLMIGFGVVCGLAYLYNENSKAAAALAEEEAALVEEEEEEAASDAPHKIKLGGQDGWCNSDGSIHQDVPGCGRVCSSGGDNPLFGMKDTTDEGLEWQQWDTSNSQSIIEACPDAKIDELWDTSDFNNVTMKPGVSKSDKDLRFEAKPGHTKTQYVTLVDESGGGNLINHNRHGVSCSKPGEYLTGFQRSGLIETDEGNEGFKIEYSCIGPTGGSDISPSDNKETTTISYDTTVLELVPLITNHNVNCETQFIKRQFVNFKEDDGEQNTLNYDYECSARADLNTCRDVETTPDDYGDGSAANLDSHHVKCRDSEGLVQFQLHHDETTNKINYKYKCCQPS